MSLLKLRIISQRQLRRENAIDLACRLRTVNRATQMFTKILEEGELYEMENVINDGFIEYVSSALLSIMSELQSINKNPISPPTLLISVCPIYGILENKLDELQKLYLVYCMYQEGCKYPNEQVVEECNRLFEKTINGIYSIMCELLDLITLHNKDELFQNYLRNEKYHPSIKRIISRFKINKEVSLINPDNKRQKGVNKQ